MSTHSGPDRQILQNFLASAFAVQQSGLDTRSLVTLLDLQRSVTTGESSLDRTMHLVTERARNVANAAGVAIAVVQGNQLVYRAGSGYAAAYVGHRVTAILSVSAHDEARGEILRVENAEVDARIEAAICRQFGAQSLLILPIYRERSLAGVLQVLFSEAHTFQEQETRIYRMIAGLVGEALYRDAQANQAKVQAPEPSPALHTLEQITSEVQRFPGVDKSAAEPSRDHQIGQTMRGATPSGGELPEVRQPARPLTRGIKELQHILLPKLRWNVAVSVVVSALVIAAGWTLYERQLPLGASSLLRSKPAQQRIQIDLTKPTPVPQNTLSTTQTAAGGGQGAKTSRSAFQRVVVGPNEIDYVADDVTVRRFIPKPAPTPAQSKYKQVDLGEDVTVRYFPPQSAVVSQTQPAPAQRTR